MVDVFISYSRRDQDQVAMLAHMVEAEGYDVWWDADLPPHQSYGDVITAKISAARAAIVVWSADSVQSEWVRAEADMARNQKKLIQTSIDEVMPPLPFNQIQYAGIGDWQGEPDHMGWRKVKASLSELCGQREAGSVQMPVNPRPAAARPRPSQYAAPASAPAASRWPLFAGIGVAVVAVAAALFIVMRPPAEEQIAQPAAAGAEQAGMAATPAPAPTASPTASPTPAPVSTIIEYRNVPVAVPAARAAPSLDAPSYDLVATVADPDGFTNVRKSPSTRSDILGRVQVGERFATYRQAGDWWRVKLADGTEGYISRSRIRLPGETGRAAAAGPALG